ncbi:MAG: (Fe-S)-binding protein, partial [Gammaproteobacteria bacterium]|nr:(Fe-S)-binding protein [Gammaproteobacteria bacterium]
MAHNPPPQKIQLFVTCLVDAFYPDVGMAVVDILEAQGITVEFPFAQTCCGQPAFNGGFWEDARGMARHTLDVLSATTGPIVIPSGSCTSMIIHHYAEILADDAVYLPKAQAVASRTYEFTQFLVDVLGVKNVGASGQGCATCHPSCHGLRNLNLRTQSQELLAEVAGLEMVELPEAESCCGFGGLFAVKMSAISGAMLARKLDNVEASGADVLVGGDVSCLMHMAGGLQR